MRFAVISDTHFFAEGHGHDGFWWNRTLSSRSLDIGRCLVETLAGFSPDFVIHCGDLVGEDEMANWDAALTMMEDIGCPWYGAIGNHGTWNPGVRAAFAAYFGLPGEQCYYAKTLGGLRFIFLDTCHWLSAEGVCAPYLDKALFDADRIKGLAVPAEEISWLRSELEASRDQPVCLVSHAPLGFKPIYPVASLPKGRPAAPGGTPFEQFNARAGACGDIVNRREVRALLSSHSCIRAAWAGHTHINDFHVEDGITYCMTGALREYPFEFRLVDIVEGTDGPHLQVTTHGLTDPQFAEESLVEEWQNLWVAGAAADRRFRVSL